MSNAVCLKENGILELFTITPANTQLELKASQCLSHHLDIDSSATLASLFKLLEKDSTAREILSLKGYPKLRHAYLSHSAGKSSVESINNSKQLIIQITCCLNLFKDDAGTGELYSQGYEWSLFVTGENFSEPESIYRFSFEELLNARFNLSDVIEIYEHDEIGDITAQYKARGAQLDLFGFLNTLMNYLTELSIKTTYQARSV